MEKKKVLKKSKAADEVAAQKNKAEFKKDVSSYFTERDKTINKGSGKKEDARQIAEAEAEVKELLYKNSMEDKPISKDVEPLFNTIFLTARRNRVRTESGLLLATALLDGDASVDYQDKQIVLAHGPQVQQAVTGAEVVIDFESLRVKLSESMGQKVNKDSEIKIPLIEIDGTEYIAISERNLKYISKKVCK